MFCNLRGIYMMSFILAGTMLISIPVRCQTPMVPETYSCNYASEYVTVLSSGAEVYGIARSDAKTLPRMDVAFKGLSSLNYPKIILSAKTHLMERFHEDFLEFQSLTIQMVSLDSPVEADAPKDVWCVFVDFLYDQRGWHLIVPLLLDGRVILSNMEQADDLPHGPYDDIIDKYGDIREPVANQYFDELNKHLLQNDPVDSGTILPADRHSAIIKYLGTLKGYEDYIRNLEVGNYYIVQDIESEGVYQLAIPKREDTEEGKLLWKIAMNLFVAFKGNVVLSIYPLHETSKGRLLTVGRHKLYVSVESSLGMNYSQVRLLVFENNNFGLPRHNEVVYSSGSVVPTIMLHWTIESDAIKLEGYSDSNDQHKLVRVNKKLSLR
jgi:hypothetical protein